MQMLRSQLMSPGTPSFPLQLFDAQRLTPTAATTNSIQRKYQQWAQDRSVRACARAHTHAQTHTHTHSHTHTDTHTHTHTHTGMCFYRQGCRKRDADDLLTRGSVESIRHQYFTDFTKMLTKRGYRPVSPYTITFGVRLLTFKNVFNAKRCILSTTFKSASKPQTSAP